MMIENFRERDSYKIPLSEMWVGKSERRAANSNLAQIIKYKNEVNVYRSIFVDRMD